MPCDCHPERFGDSKQWILQEGSKIVFSTCETICGMPGCRRQIGTRHGQPGWRGLMNHVISKHLQALTEANITLDKELLDVDTGKLEPLDEKTLQGFEKSILKAQEVIEAGKNGISQKELTWRNQALSRQRREDRKREMVKKKETEARNKMRAQFQASDLDNLMEGMSMEGMGMVVPGQEQEERKASFKERKKEKARRKAERMNLGSDFAGKHEDGRPRRISRRLTKQYERRKQAHEKSEVNVEARPQMKLLDAVPFNPRPDSEETIPELTMVQGVRMD